MSTTSAYAAGAAEYTDLLGSMSAVHPSDRQIIDTWASSIEGNVMDAGCGPGHWTGHLNDLKHEKLKPAMKRRRCVPGYLRQAPRSD